MSAISTTETSGTIPTGRHVRRGRPRRRGCRRGRLRGPPGRRRRRRPAGPGCRRGRSGRSGRAWPGRRRPGGATPGRSAVRISRTVARAEASGRTTTEGAIRAGSPLRRAAGVHPARHDRLEPVAEHCLVEVLLTDLPDRDADVVLRPRPRRPDGGALQGEERSRIGQQADPVAGQHRDPRTPVGRLHLDGHRPPAYLLGYGDHAGAVVDAGRLPEHCRRAPGDLADQPGSPGRPRLG